MHRCQNRGFCCGAGGARMWMEERIGTRINENRIEEALALNPDTISTACPYCLVMLGDAVNAKKAAGHAKDTLEVIDVAQLLARSATPPPIPAALASQEGEAEGSTPP
jgi:Fe-S oxidoreductase